MTATMMNMELRFVDNILPNQIEIGDIIKIDDEYLTVKSWVENKDGFDFIFTNDYEEEVSVFISDDQFLKWFIFTETE